LGNFLRVLLRNYLRFFTGKFAVDLFLLLAENSAGKFPADFTNRRKQLPTEVLAGSPNLQEIRPNLQENPQVNRKFLVVIYDISRNTSHHLLKN
jgi:hypothetical protein